jgi:hypothetical protein
MVKGAQRVWRKNTRVLDTEARDRFYFREEIPSSQESVGHEAAMFVVVKRKYLLLPGIELRLSSP